MENLAKFEFFVMQKRKKNIFLIFDTKFNKLFNKAVGPGKNPELINVGPTFIPESKVCNFTA